MRHFRALLAVTLLAALFYGVFIARTAFSIESELRFTLIDDAMISMRYARNLADGYGLVWNPGGEAVEGYTNPLWTVFMAGVHLLPIPERLVSLPVMILGALLLLAITLMSFQLAGIWGAVLLACYFPLVFWTLRGMETGPVVFLLLLSVVAANEQKHPFLLGILGALAYLTRVDSLLPWTAILLFSVRQTEPGGRTKPLYAAVLLVLVTVLVHTVWRLWFYSDWLPNTYYLKVGGVGIAERILCGTKGAWKTTQVELVLGCVIAIWGYVERRSLPHPF